MKRPLAILVAVSLASLTGCVTGKLPVNVPGLTKVKQATGIAKTDAEQIAMVLDDVQRGMQAHQIYKVLAHVSRDYHDAEGRDYAALQQYLSEIFKNYRTIRITRIPPRIVVQDNQARAVETFGTVADPGDASVRPPVNVQGQVAVSLVKVEEEWLIVEWGALL